MYLHKFILVMGVFLFHTLFAESLFENTEQKQELDSVKLHMPPARPTVTDVKFHVDEISEIDVVENSFNMIGYMELNWEDPRLKFDVQVEGTPEKVYIRDEAEEKLDSIWWPDIEFINALQKREIKNSYLSIMHTGKIVYKEKFSVVLAGEFDLFRFPFDSQKLEVEIESFSWPAHSLEFHTENSHFTFRDEFHIPEWKIEEIETEIVQKKRPQNEAKFYELEVNIELKREAGYYLWKVMLPMIVIVIVLMFVFLIDPTDLGDRLQVSFIGILTVVAYQFVIADKLPNIPYFTLADGILTCSFVIMILTTLQSAYVKILSEKNLDAANRFDKLSMIYYLGMYLLAMLVVFVYHYFK